MIRSLSFNPVPLLQGTALRRGAIFGTMLMIALAAFELFNFSTTSFALRDVLGDLSFGGLRWATILALAFCGIDFAGIARILTPEKGRDEPAEVWYLFAAWLLAASFNATLTWWGVSVAIHSHTSIGGSLVGDGAMASTVPVLVAIMVWLVRVLIIGTFSIAGERLFTLDTSPARGAQRSQAVGRAPQTQFVRPSQPSGMSASAFSRGVARPAPKTADDGSSTYRPMGFVTAADGDASEE